MARERKLGTKINILLEESLNKELEKINKETGIPKTTIIEKALEQYFKTLKKSYKWLFINSENIKIFKLEAN